MDKKESSQLETFVQWIRSFKNHSLKNEDDVETKFVLPLFRYLGYPEECRRGKFPLKAYSPGKAGRKPEIDQVYFSVDTSDKQGEDTSLVVVEAKNPTQNIDEDIFQARFYGDILKPMFLVLTNGLRLKVLKRDRVQGDEIIFDNEIEVLKNGANGTTNFYHQLNFETVKHIKEEYAADVLKHKEYIRIDRILRKYPDIQEILDRGDFKPVDKQQGKVVTFVKPKVAIEYELPMAFERGSCKIEFSSVTRRELKIYLTRKDILGDLLIGLHTPPDWQTRPFINRIGDNTFEVQVGQTETVLSKAEANDLCSCVDRLGRDYSRILTEAETALETWDYMPMKLESIPGFRLLSVMPNLWHLMKDFAEKFDSSQGRSEWHIFYWQGTAIRISHVSREHAIIWPKKYKEIKGLIFPSQYFDLMCAYSDWQLQAPGSTDLAKWKQSVGPNGIWTARYINSWLTQEFIPKVLQQYGLPVQQLETNPEYFIKDYPSEYTLIREISNPKQLIPYLRKIQEWLAHYPVRKLRALLIRPFYDAFTALARTAKSSTVDIPYVSNKLMTVDIRSESSEEECEAKRFNYILKEWTYEDVLKHLAENVERINRTECEDSLNADSISRVFIAIIERGEINSSQAQLNAAKRALLPLWQQCRFEIRHIFLNRSGPIELID